MALKSSGLITGDPRGGPFWKVCELHTLRKVVCGEIPPLFSQTPFSSVGCQNDFVRIHQTLHLLLLDEVRACGLLASFKESQKKGQVWLLCVISWGDAEGKGSRTHDPVSNPSLHRYGIRMRDVVSS